MRKIRYSVAMSLDGYIADPDGGFDWIIQDPEIEFAAMMSEFDTLLAGRGTYEVMKTAGNVTMPGMKTVVISSTLRQTDHPGVTVVNANIEAEVEALRRQPGKDIWLFGGGELFRSLATAGLVDTVEVGVIPVLLGGGIPLLPVPSNRIRLSLTSHKTYQTGIVSLKYAITNSD